jgi:hypothetical protein
VRLTISYTVCVDTNVDFVWCLRCVSALHFDRGRDFGCLFSCEPDCFGARYISWRKSGRISLLQGMDVGRWHDVCAD